MEGWPPLPYDAWKDTCDTLHLWTQIVGKVKLQLAPFLNELWQTGFYVTARGLTTGIMPYRYRVLEVRFDFVDHNLSVWTDGGQVKQMPLMPRSVADFYTEFMGVLQSLGVEVSITKRPSEMAVHTPFDQDQDHASYDPNWVQRWWRVLTQTAIVLQRYRSGFTGKSSPILFYWGGFDLATARYAGRPAPPVKGPIFYQVAEDQENVSCGFWPGGTTAAGVNFDEATFYSYINPAPEGYAQTRVQPEAAYFESSLGEFVLRYEDARRSSSPEDTVLAFFQSAYEAGASLAQWDRDTLERTPPPPYRHMGG